MTARKPRVIMKKQDRIDYILNGLCDYYSIPMDRLVCDARSTERSKRKRIAVKILRDVADCSLKDIQYIYGHTDESCIFQIYQKVQDDLDPRYGNKEVREEYKNVLQYLGI